MNSENFICGQDGPRITALCQEWQRNYSPTPPDWSLRFFSESRRSADTGLFVLEHKLRHQKQDRRSEGSARVGELAWTLAVALASSPLISCRLSNPRSDKSPPEKIYATAHLITAFSIYVERNKPSVFGHIGLYNNFWRAKINLCLVRVSLFFKKFRVLFSHPATCLNHPFSHAETSRLVLGGSAVSSTRGGCGFKSRGFSFLSGFKK